MDVNKKKKSREQKEAASTISQASDVLVLLHYHSSVNMLKTSRGRFQNWLASKGEMERGNLWKLAGRNGRKMRERHRQEERNQLQTEKKGSFRRNQ